jgi:FKBP12-rapamycin complex-associated protein
LKNISQLQLEAIHGALLAFRCLFNQEGKYLEDSKYREAFEQIFRLREHKEFIVRKTVVSSFPGLAKHESDFFVKDYLHFTVDFLLNQARKEKDKSICKLLCVNFDSSDIKLS